MTQEKQLLLQDLSARLPYGVKIELTWWIIGEGTCINTTLEPDNIEQLLNDEDGGAEIKPYLRPLSSMTEEERNEMSSIISPQGSAIYYNEYIGIPLTHLAQQIPYAYIARVID